MSHFQENFVAQSAAVRVRFGAGVRHSVADEVRARGCSRALILSTPQQADTAREFADLCGPLAVGIYTDATMHTPVAISDHAAAYAVELVADCVVAVGGGSTTGLGKAIAYRTDLPQIVIPTTYAGSEATPILGQTENGRKTTLTSAIEAGGSSLRDFIRSDGSSGYFQQQYFVYGRANDKGGEPCRVCSAPIKMIRQGQRSTFYCENCQSQKTMRSSK